MIGIPTDNDLGRILAVWLTHSYAHTSKHLNFLPDSLKGADMSFYETASALGLWCRVVPIMKGGYRYYYDRDGALLMASKSHGFNEGKNSSGNINGEDGIGFGSEMPVGKVAWLNPSPKKDKSEKTKGREEREKQHKGVQLAYMTVH